MMRPNPRMSMRRNASFCFKFFSLTRCQLRVLLAMKYQRQKKEVSLVKCGWLKIPCAGAGMPGCPAFGAHCWPRCWSDRLRLLRTALCRLWFLPGLAAYLLTEKHKEKGYLVWSLSHEDSWNKLFLPLFTDNELINSN